MPWKKLRRIFKKIKDETFETMADIFVYKENLMSLIKALEDVSIEQKKQGERLYKIEEKVDNIDVKQESTQESLQRLEQNMKILVDFFQNLKIN